MAIEITVNGKRHSTEATPDTPLLYVLRDDLELRGAKFGCGLSQCGACSVLVDGREIRSCVTPVEAVVGRKVTTLEGLPAWYAEEKQLATVPKLHPLQQAWIDEQVPQCGYCQSGMIIMAADLLSRNARPSDAEIKEAMDPHLCRCATHNAIVRGIKRAATAAV
jgi:aerobic-type carbon monoxide dehydrogenase small subunit (CoxS/CutS family)